MISQHHNLGQINLKTGYAWLFYVLSFILHCWEKGKKIKRITAQMVMRRPSFQPWIHGHFYLGCSCFMFVCFLLRVEEIKNWLLNTGPRLITDNFRGSSKLWSLVSFRFIGAQTNTVYWEAGHCKRFLNVGFPMAREGCIDLSCWLVK